MFTEVAIQKLLKFVSSRLCERKCEWLDCDVTMNSGDNLELHVARHVADLGTTSVSFRHPHRTKMPSLL
jgi:hypothetical protein